MQVSQLKLFAIDKNFSPCLADRGDGSIAQPSPRAGRGRRHTSAVFHRGVRCDLLRGRTAARGRRRECRARVRARDAPRGTRPGGRTRQPRALLVLFGRHRADGVRSRDAILHRRRGCARRGHGPGNRPEAHRNLLGLRHRAGLAAAFPGDGHAHRTTAEIASGRRGAIGRARASEISDKTAARIGHDYLDVLRSTSRTPPTPAEASSRFRTRCSSPRSASAPKSR